jgi:xylulokinase
VSGLGGGPDVTVGIDIGTTSVKAVAADDDGNVLARTRVPHRVEVPDPGSFQHDADQAWRADVVDALAQVAPAGHVTGVAVSAMVPSLAAIGTDGRAVSPGLLYGDRRGDRPAAEGTSAGDHGELLAFLAWLAREHPEAAHFWPAQAVANHALTGRGAIDTMTAMTGAPLFHRQGWSEELAVGAGASLAALADIVRGDEPVGQVLAGRPGAGALVAGGTIDAMSEQLVADTTHLGDVQVLCGTTMITWGVIQDWREVPGLWTIPHTVPDRVLIGGPSNAGGLFLDRARRWVGECTPAELDALAPGDLPVWLPYVRGERTPLHRRDLRARVEDLAVHHDPAHVLRAAYEAAGFVVRHHLDLAREVGLAPTRILATGGGTQVPHWMRALADCTGLPVEVAAVPEGAALGAAFIARVTAGSETDITAARRWAAVSHTVEPDPAWVEAAEARYQRFRALTARAVAEGR